MAEQTPGDIIADHAELIGRLTLAWNDVQGYVYMLFECFSGLSKDKAHAIFSAIRSDSNQREIVLALGRIAMAASPKRVERLEKVIHSLNRLASSRNAAIHTIWGVELPSGQMGPSAIAPKLKGLQQDFVTQFQDLKETLRKHFWELHEIYLEQTNHPTRRATDAQRSP